MFGLKYICMWFLANYSYDNILKTYYSENSFGEMSNFIKHQQEREDILRGQCNLQMYIISPKVSLFEIYYNKFDTYLDNYLDTYYITTKMEASSKEELLTLSYIKEYEGIDIVFQEKTFTLISVGIKPRKVYSYSNQMYDPDPVKPTWKLTLDNITMTISDIE